MITICKRIIFACLTVSTLSGCTAPIMLGYVVTSPKLLFYANNKSYEKQLDVDIIIDGKKITIHPIIKCQKQNIYFGGAATGSWEQNWGLKLEGNKIYHNHNRYRINLGNFDPKNKVYNRYKSSRSWCKTFLKDSKSIKRINNNNSLVLVYNGNDGFKNNKTISIYNNKIINRGFIYITKDNKENKQQNNISSPIADNVIIKGFKIHSKNLQDISDK